MIVSGASRMVRTCMTDFIAKPKTIMIERRRGESYWVWTATSFSSFSSDFVSIYFSIFCQRLKWRIGVFILKAAGVLVRFLCVRECETHKEKHEKEGLFRRPGTPNYDKPCGNTVGAAQGTQSIHCDVSELRVSCNFGIWCAIHHGSCHRNSGFLLETSSQTPQHMPRGSSKAHLEKLYKMGKTQKRKQDMISAALWTIFLPAMTLGCNKNTGETTTAITATRLLGGHFLETWMEGKDGGWVLCPTPWQPTPDAQLVGASCFYSA